MENMIDDPQGYLLDDLANLRLTSEGKACHWSEIVVIRFGRAADIQQENGMLSGVWST